MSVTETDLPGVYLFEPRVFCDDRGFFLETFRSRAFEALGLDDEFVQHNHSRSQRGVLRGLHFQREKPQGKLVRCARGAIFDVAVDIRRDSSHFAHWVGVVLDDETHRQLYVPPGFAHGFLVLSEVADVVYKCTDYYHPESEGGVVWDDPILDIDWPITDPILSKKDSHWPGASAL